MPFERVNLLAGEGFAPGGDVLDMPQGMKYHAACTLILKLPEWRLALVQHELKGGQCAEFQTD